MGIGRGPWSPGIPRTPEAQKDNVMTKTENKHKSTYLVTSEQSVYYVKVDHLPVGPVFPFGPDGPLSPFTPVTPGTPITPCSPFTPVRKKASQELYTDRSL